MVMELNLTPESCARLNELALRTKRGTDELIEEAVVHLMDYNEWLEQKVGRSSAAAARGEISSDDTVRAWLESRERSLAD
jgi:predicted transcriptional regulator